MNQLNFLIIIALFVSFKSVAQEKEYIVTNDNDTIYGKVTRGTNWLNTSEVIYKIKDSEGKKTRINPSEVRMIRSLKGADGDCFIVTIYDKWFLKKIMAGRINVFQLVDGVILYVSKDGSDITSTDIGWFFSSKKAHSQIRPLLEDHPTILREYDSLKGTTKNILQTIEKYNASQ
jgi:hypothetical protein